MWAIKGFYYFRALFNVSERVGERECQRVRSVDDHCSSQRTVLRGGVVYVYYIVSRSLSLISHSC